jgi:hypothetical protein
MNIVSLCISAISVLLGTALVCCAAIPGVWWYRRRPFEGHSDSPMRIVVAGLISATTCASSYVLAFALFAFALTNVGLRR